MEIQTVSKYYGILTLEKRATTVNNCSSVYNIGLGPFYVWYDFLEILG
jgi:hypothetical protein